jgi:hypothetical protein
MGSRIYVYSAATLSNYSACRSTRKFMLMTSKNPDDVVVSCETLLSLTNYTVSPYRIALSSYWMPWEQKNAINRLRVQSTFFTRLMLNALRHRNVVVDIETGIEAGQNRSRSSNSGRGMKPRPAPTPSASWPMDIGRDMKLIKNLHLVLRLRMSGPNFHSLICQRGVYKDSFTFTS